MTEERRKWLKVGAVARRAGITVRTLHHWEELGLLRPGGRTPSGHRLYGEEELGRLQKILSLKSLGMRLEEIRNLLARGEPELEEVLAALRERVREQRRLLGRLESRLGRLLESLGSGGQVTEEEFFHTMEMMNMIDEYFTPEQLEALERRRAALGPETIRKAEEEWPKLIARVREQMEKGTDPSSEEVRRLAVRWRELIQSFSGGDRDIEASLGKMYRAEPEMARSQGLSPELFAYLAKAWEALGPTST